MELINFIKNLFQADSEILFFVMSAILLSMLIQALILRIKKISLVFILLFNALLFVTLYLIVNVYFKMFVVISIPSLFLAFFLYALFPRKEKEEIDPLKVVMEIGKGAPVVINNIMRGLAIFGSAGAGKTASIFVPIIRHCAKHNFCGMSYDFKNGELTEIINYFYAKSNVPVYSIVPHRPDLSYRVNPVHPDYIKGTDDLDELISVLFTNTREPGAKADPFFDKVPEAALCGVIWRLKEEFPEQCTLPHAIALCLSSAPLVLAEFIAGNKRSKILGRPFLDATGSDNTMASLKSCLSNSLRRFALPNLFYVLTGNEVNLAVNHKEHKSIINLVNSPSKENVNNPFLALLFSCIMNQMRERNREKAVLILDEAATLNIPKFSRIPATLRSFMVATIYSLQDKVLGEEQMGAVAIKSILANLSYIFAGKANDPDSIKYYKQMMEEVKEKKLSRSYSNDVFAKGESRLSESQETTSKYKNQDYSGLKPGEFLVMADGQDRKVRFVEVPFERIPMKVRNHLTNQDIDNQFDEIFETVEAIIEKVVDVSEFEDAE